MTIVEWGSGLVESLAADRLEIVLDRPRGAGPAGPDAAAADDDEDPAAGVRRVTITTHGDRWAGVTIPTPAVG